MRSEVVFWVFAAVGALPRSSQQLRNDSLLAVQRGDWVLAITAVVLVRVLAFGIRLVP